MKVVVGDDANVAGRREELPSDTLAGEDVILAGPVVVGLGEEPLDASPLKQK